MSAHIVRKVWFRSVRKLRILRSSAIKWLCYAALIPCFCASFHVECHTCAICAFMAKSCSKCRFCRAWLSAELLFRVLGTVSAPASAKYCPSHLGRYLVPIAARKFVSCFCQIVSLCCWDIYKMCAKIWVSWTENFRVGVTQNRLVHGTDSWSISLKKKENYFNSDPWICLLNRIIKLLWS